MQDDRTDGGQGRIAGEPTTAVAQSRAAAERLWAEIGRLLTAGKLA